MNKLKEIQEVLELAWQKATNRVIQELNKQTPK